MGRSKAQRVFLAALPLLCGAFLVACSLDYGSAGGSGTGAESAPTAILRDYSHTVVVRGERAFVLTAKSAEAYDQDKKTILSDVTFAEYDPDTKELVSKGRADSAVFYTESEDAELSGNVHLESKRQDAVLEGEYLRWDGKAKRLEGRLDGKVSVSRGDGSWVSGAGFEADARHRSFSFMEGARGLITDSGSSP